jgi:hypothetical protein
MEMRSGLVPEPSATSDLFRVPTRMSAMRAIMVQNNDAEHKLWITEVGDRGAPRTVDPPADNERRQANFLRSMYWMLWRDREFVAHVFWFKYEDFAVPSDPRAVGTENWGVVRLLPRPADQTCPQMVPAGQQTCEYEANGTVQRFKLSYQTYQDIAENGFQQYTTFIPMVTVQR